MDEKIIIKSSDESLVIEPKGSPIIDIREKAIKSITNLLDIENIVQIIYIDDKFDIESQKEEYKARLIKLKNENNFLKSKTFTNIDWNGPVPRFSKMILDLWDESADKSSLLYEICKHDSNEEDANFIPTLDIENCFGERIKLMTPDQWLEDKYKVIEDLDEGEKAICLFDFEFQTGSERIRSSNGVVLAKSLVEQERFAKKVICGIFSHKFTEEEEDDYRDDYCNKYHIEKGSFYTISKYRFAFDPQIAGFAEGVKNLILLQYIELLKVESLALLKESNKKAGDKIQDITPKTFNQIIQKSSLKEGVWEVNTLFRLYGILSKVENFNLISNQEIRKKFNNSIKGIREIDLVDTGYQSNAKNLQLIDLRSSELYIVGETINKLHLPLANGDIFKIKDKEYILLVQPCNLALRTDGKRSHNYDNAFLVPIEKCKIEKLNHTKHEVFTAYKISDEVLCANFSKFQVLSLDYLDLTVFNEDGKSFIDMRVENLQNEVIHTPWIKRYKAIQKKLTISENTIKSYTYLTETVDSIKNELNALKREIKNVSEENRLVLSARYSSLTKKRGELERHCISIQKSIHSVENFASFKLDSIDNYSVANRVFSFEIQRIKHYKSPYSDDLLQKFMLYLSRNAFEHDFTS